VQEAEYSRAEQRGHSHDADEQSAEALQHDGAFVDAR
jgi:hypothetical protein